MNRMTIIALAALAFAGCASQTEDHLEEGQTGVTVEGYSWGLGGIGMPAKFQVQPGDSVERSTRTCEIADGVSACRQPLDVECTEAEGIALPGYRMRANRCEEGPGFCTITVTVECRFPGGES